MSESSLQLEIERLKAEKAELIEFAELFLANLENTQRENIAENKNIGEDRKQSLRDLIGRIKKALEAEKEKC